MDTLSYIIGRNSAGGGSGSTPSWSDVTGKPFSTVGAGLTVTAGALQEVVPLYTESSGQTYGPGMKIIGFSGNLITIAGSDEVAIFAADTDYTVTAKSEGTIYTGSWNSTTNTWLDTANGFTYSIAAGGKGVDYTFTVGALNSVEWVLVEPIDPNEANLTEANVQLIGSGNITWTTVDESTTVVHELPAQYIATALTPYALASSIPVVPTDVSAFNNDAGYITATALTPYALTTDIPDVSSFITAAALTPYVEASSLATVATSGLYSDLSGAPSIPSVAAAAALTTGVEVGSVTVDGTTTTFYAPQGGGTAVTPNWNATSGQDGYIDNKPNIKAGTNSTLEGVILGQGTGNRESTASGMGAIASGGSNTASGMYSLAIGSDNTANASWATAFGSGIKAYGTNMFARGKYNVNGSSGMFNFYADVIGNGSANNSRSNAEATDWSGNKYLAGDIYTHVTDWASPTSNSIKLANIPAPDLAELQLQSGGNGTWQVSLHCTVDYFTGDTVPVYTYYWNIDEYEPEQEPEPEEEPEG